MNDRGPLEPPSVNSHYGEHTCEITLDTLAVTPMSRYASVWRAVQAQLWLSYHKEARVLTMRENGTLKWLGAEVK